MSSLVFDDFNRMRNLVGAVVVSYKPSLELLQNVTLLIGQVDHVVVVDNTQDSDVFPALMNLERLQGCTVIRNNKNLGIAAALNIGFYEAMRLGFPWVLTFDQDSQISEGYVEAMFSGISAAKNRSRIGILFPRYLDKKLRIEIPMNRNAKGEAVGCWTSGSMIESAVFKSVGLFEEQLFIDFVDYEYCMRMRLMGFELIECPKAILLHSLGRITLHRLLGTITNHNPKRRYYITRNRLVLIRRYFRMDREWSITELKDLIMDSLRVLLAEDRKLAKAGYMLRALYDGALNRLGQRVVME